MDSATVKGLAPVSGQMVIAAFILVALAATTQRSRTADFCGLSDRLFNSSWMLHRASPVFCVLDTVSELTLLLRPSKTPSPTDEKSETTPILGVRAHRRRSIFQWLPLILAALPASVVFACRGIPVAQGCVAIYLVSIFVHTISLHYDLEPQTKDTTAQIVAPQIFTWHLLYSMPIWTAAGWHITTPLTEAYGLGDVSAWVRFGVLVFELCLLASAAAMPCVPSSWRLSNTTLLFTNLIFGSAMLSNYITREQKNADGTMRTVVIPKPVWEFLGYLSFGATTALIVPIALSLGLSTLIYWMRVSSVSSITAASAETSPVKEDAEEEHTPDEASSQHTLPGDGGKRSWAAYRSEVWTEFLRILLHSVYVAKAAEMFGRWYLRLVPEVRWMAFLIFNVLTLMVYYGFVYTGEGTTAPRWLSEAWSSWWSAASNGVSL